MVTRSKDRRLARQRARTDSRDPEPADLGAAMIKVESMFSGPLPPPEVLAGYDEIVPGMAERLLVKFEKQADHRMSLEKRVIDGDVRRSWAGLLLGFTFGVALLVASVYMIANGFAVAGIIVIATELVAIAVALIYSTETRRRERQRKQG